LQMERHRNIILGMKKIILVAIALFVAVHFFGFNIRDTASYVARTAVNLIESIIPFTGDDFEDIDSQINAVVIKSGSSEAITKAFDSSMRSAKILYEKCTVSTKRFLSKNFGITFSSSSSSKAQTARYNNSSSSYSFDFNNMDISEQSALRQTLIDYSMNLRGIRYNYGSENPNNGFDCSGFIRYATKNSINVALPRTAQEMYNCMEKISPSEREPGDLVFFRANGRIDHVGIYLGRYQGSGSLHGREIFINAASQGPRTGVVVSALDEPYWRRHYSSSGRFLPSSMQIAEASVNAEE